MTSDQTNTSPFSYMFPCQIEQCTIRPNPQNFNKLGSCFNALGLTPVPALFLCLCGSPDFTPAVRSRVVRSCARYKMSFNLVRLIEA